MSRNEWQEQDLLLVAQDTPLANLAQNLGYDVKSWLGSATTSLPETLRVTRSRDDREWTETLLRELGGEPLSWGKEACACKCLLLEAKRQTSEASMCSAFSTIRGELRDKKQRACYQSLF